MKVIKIVIFFISICSVLQGQEYKTRIIFDSLGLQQIRTLESTFNSSPGEFRKINVSADFFRGAVEKMDYYPLTFRWTSDDFNPNCLVEYYYFGKDSIARVIIYNWDIMNDVNNLKIGKSKILEQQNRKEEYLKKYKLIYDIVVDKFGKPTKENKVKESKDGFFGNATWDTKGKIIELFFSFTPKVKELGEFAFGTFRVRLKIDNN